MQQLWRMQSRKWLPIRNRHASLAMPDTNAPANCSPLKKQSPACERFFCSGALFVAKRQAASTFSELALQQIANAVHCVQINAMRSAAHEFLAYQVRLIVNLCGHQLRRRSFMWTVSRHLQQIAAFGPFDRKLDPAGTQNDLTNRILASLLA